MSRRKATGDMVPTNHQQQQLPCHDDQQIVAVKELPGYYYDPRSRKYYRIIRGHSQHDPSIRHEAEAKRLKYQQDEKARQFRRGASAENRNIASALRQRSLGGTGHVGATAFQYCSVTRMMENMSVAKPAFTNVFKGDNIVRMCRTSHNVFVYSKKRAVLNPTNMTVDEEAHHSIDLLKPKNGVFKAAEAAVDADHLEDGGDSPPSDVNEFFSKQKITIDNEVETFDVVQTNNGDTCLIAAECTATSEPGSNRYLHLYTYPEVLEPVQVSLGLRKVSKVVRVCLCFLFKAEPCPEP